MGGKKDKKTKIKKILKDIVKIKADWIDAEDITYSEVIEKIGKMQEPKFKFRALK